MKLIYSLAIAAVLSAFATDAHAQLITWQPSVNIFQGDPADQSFVSTNGTLVEAFNGGGNAVTLNGVAFDAMDIETFGEGVLPRTSGGGTFSIGMSNINFGAFQEAEFAGTDVGLMINSGLWAVDNVTLNNLTIGNTYEIQLFNQDGRNDRNNSFIAGYGNGDGSGPVGMLELNNSTTNDGSVTFPETNAGDYLIGTFTADATSLTFLCYGTTSGDPANLTNGDSRGQINGIQLRDTTDGDDGALKGDVNMDTIVNFLDISPFISQLSTGDFLPEADCNCDLEVNFLDISPFIRILAGG